MNYRLGIVILYVRDIKTMGKFYTEVVGLPVVKEQSSEAFVTLATASGPWIALADVTKPSPFIARLLHADGARAKPEDLAAPGGVQLGLEVDDVDLTWREWSSKGVRMLAAPEDFAFGRAFDAEDPEGHLLNVYKLRAR